MMWWDRPTQQVATRALSVFCTVECAGNGRSFLAQRQPGVPWGAGAVGHAEWTGVPVGLLLQRAGLQASAAEVLFEGHDVDFWNLKGGKGRVRFKKIVVTTGGPVYGGFLVEQEHVDLTVPGGKVALVEEWDVRAWNLGGAGPFVWDVVSTIRCAGESKLKLPKFHYGGMALRGARSWVKEASTFLTSEGKGREP